MAVPRGYGNHGVSKERPVTTLDCLKNGAVTLEADSSYTLYASFASRGDLQRMLGVTDENVQVIVGSGADEHTLRDGLEYPLAFSWAQMVLNEAALKRG